MMLLFSNVERKTWFWTRLRTRFLWKSFRKQLLRLSYTLPHFCLLRLRLSLPLPSNLESHTILSEPQGEGSCANGSSCTLLTDDIVCPDMIPKLTRENVPWNTSITPKVYKQVQTYIEILKKWVKALAPVYLCILGSCHIVYTTLLLTSAGRRDRITSGCLIPWACFVKLWSKSNITSVNTEATKFVKRYTK